MFSTLASAKKIYSSKMRTEIYEVFSSQGNKSGNTNFQPGCRKQPAFLHSVRRARKFRGAKRYINQQSLANPPSALKPHVHLKNSSGFQTDRKLRSIFFVPLQQFKDLSICTPCECCSIKLFHRLLATVKPERRKMETPRNEYNRSTVKIVFEAINL